MTHELAQARANRFLIYKKEDDLRSDVFFSVDMYEEILTLLCDGYSLIEIQSFRPKDKRLDYYFYNCGFARDAEWVKPNRYPKAGNIANYLRNHFADEYKDALGCAIETLESQITDYKELRYKADTDENGKLEASSIQLLRVWVDACKNKINNYRRIINNLEIKEDNGIQIKIVRYGDSDAN